MKFDCQFKNLNYSESLVEYTMEKFKKLKKFEIKPFDVHVTYSSKRHLKLVDVYINGINGTFRAHSEADSFKGSVDQIIFKLHKQMVREKSKLKDHKGPKELPKEQPEEQFQDEANEWPEAS